MSGILRTVSSSAGFIAAWALHDTNKNNSSRSGQNDNGCESVDLAEMTKKLTRFHGSLPTRQQQIGCLKNGDYDVVVIGGGLVGGGCAVEAAKRGYKTALVDMNDFGSSAALRHTTPAIKLIKRAVKKPNIKQIITLRHTLREQARIAEEAPHLTHTTSVLLPVYKRWHFVAYYLLSKVHDMDTGSDDRQRSFVVGRKLAAQMSPLLKREQLMGAVVVKCRHTNDARLSVCLALTACRLGASIVNHCKVVALTKELVALEDQQGGTPRITGVVCEDQLSGERFNVTAKCVINAGGVMVDAVRKLDDPLQQNICCHSAGLHMVLPGYYCGRGIAGFVDSSCHKHHDFYFLPYKKHTLVGSTHCPVNFTDGPLPKDGHIKYLLHELRHFLGDEIEVRRGDVISAWSGIYTAPVTHNRQLPECRSDKYVLEMSPSGLLSVVAGHWTSYRTISSCALDKAAQTLSLSPSLIPESGYQPHELQLVEGAHHWSPTLHITLVQDLGMDTDVAQHLAATYGDRAFAVAKQCRSSSLQWPVCGRRLHEHFPFIEAEIRHAIQREFAVTALDIVAGRVPLAQLNTAACRGALPKILDVMAEELNWSKTEKQRQRDTVLHFLAHDMGELWKDENRRSQGISLSVGEMEQYTSKFKQMDCAKKGCINVSQLRTELSDFPGTLLHQVLSDIDPSDHGCLDLTSYLYIMSAVLAYRRSQRENNTSCPR